MKFRKRIWLMLGLPISTQLIFVALLSFHLHQIDVAAAKEVNAKQIIACCLDLRDKLLRYVLTIYSRRFLDIQTGLTAIDQIAKELTLRERDLAQLLKNDPVGSTIFKKFKSSLSSYLEVSKDIEITLQGDLRLNTYSQFLSDREILEEMAFQFQEAIKAERSIVGRYLPVMNEFHPKEISTRRNLTILIVSAVLINTTIVALLAWTASRNIVSRMAQLLQNIESFTNLDRSKALDGSDEFAEIDKRFRAVAEARNRSDELRRSMYAMVSHDLRSPLTSLRLSLQMILYKHADLFDHPLTEKLNRLDNEIQRLCRLANTFLDLERIEEGKLELSTAEVEVAALVAEATTAVRGLSESKGLSVKTSMDGAPTIVCDQDRLTQVIVNLLSNSVKFSPRGSELALSVTVNDSARFEIADQGPGVPEEKQEFLFGRFSQLDQPEEIKKAGSGLGLYICKLLVEAHRGKIGVFCPPSGGSVFWFEIPQP